ncbi:MAG TPA: hypothetical protein VJL39_02165 [Candidatus Paceibacterota bacterium]
MMTRIASVCIVVAFVALGALPASAEPLVRVLTQRGCVACVYAIQYFRARGIEPAIYDIHLHHPWVYGARQFGWGTPVVEIRGRKVLGYRPDMFDALLR